MNPLSIVRAIKAKWWGNNTCTARGRHEKYIQNGGWGILGDVHIDMSIILKLMLQGNMPWRHEILCEMFFHFIY